MIPGLSTAAQTAAASSMQRNPNIRRPQRMRKNEFCAETVAASHRPMRTAIGGNTGRM